MLDKSQFTESQVEIVKHLRDESERRGFWMGCILTLVTILGIATGIIIAGNMPYIF
jgi:hypothetical protein